MARVDGERETHTLTVEELAREAGVAVADVRRFLEAGAIHPDAEGRHAVEDVMQIRLIEALAAGGIGLDDVTWVIRERGMPLDRVAEMWTLEESSGRTFEEFRAAVGEHGELLPSIYAAFGLAVPTPETLMRRDEERVLLGFLEVWELVEDRPDTYIRAARILGEGVRRIDAATVDLFGELGGPPPSRIRRGLSIEEAQRPARLIGPVIEQALVWLHRRHTEHEVFERIVSNVESVLSGEGRKEPDPAEPPAIAFVDLTGYTALAAGEGDEHAMEVATTLHTLALDAARAHEGRVVKLLGDGVILRYPSARSAVASVAALMTSIEEADMPPAHAGVAAGPVVMRDGDVFGHTVNLASRIASHAPAGTLLVPADIVGGLVDSGYACEDAGDAVLKGIVDPVPLARVRLG
jgi:adenylate cyclase